MLHDTHVYLQFSTVLTGQEVPVEVKDCESNQVTELARNRS